jgi:capsular exopolysaccharide synthesis family protein
MQDNKSINKRKSLFKPTNEFTLRDLFRVVLFRKWLIISVLLLSLGIAFYYIRVTPATYKASVTIIRETNYGKLPSQFLGTEAYDYGIDESQILVLKSQSSLEEIKRDLREKYNTDILVSRLRANLSLVGNRNDRDIVTLFALAPTAEQSQVIANVAADIFITKVAEMKSSELTQGVDFLKNQLDQVEGKMHETEKALNDFRDKEGLIPQESSGNSDTSGLLGKMGNLQTQSVEIENEVELIKSQLKTLEDLIAEKKKYAQSNSSVGMSLEIDQLRERLIGLQLDLNTKLETFTEKDPEIIALRKKIESAQNQLKSEFNKMLNSSGTIDPIAELQSLTQQFVTTTVQLKGLESKKTLIDGRVKKFREEHPEIASKQVELIRLERQSRIYEQSYSNLSGKFQELRLMQQMKGSGLKIVDRAYLPSAPIAPKKKLVLIGAGVFGLFLGLIITLFLDYMSDTIRTKEDIERCLELPVLGMIAQIGPFSVPENAVKRKSSTALVPEGSSIDNINERKTRQRPSKEILEFLSHSLIYAPNGNTKTPAIESYWNLAMSIKYANMDNPIKSILVTSSIPGERKTTTASNLAIVNARLGTKVLLIDADLKRSMLHRIFQQNRRPGLSDLITIEDISNDATFDYVTHGSIRPTVIENLYLLPCGSSVPNADVLLNSGKIENLINAFKEKFDLIIIDSPPILVVSSVVALCKEVDGVLFIMKSGRTKRKMALNSKEILDSVEAKIMGTVLTGVDYNIQYGYYYRRYYGHYYNQKDDQ